MALPGPVGGALRAVGRAVGRMQTQKGPISVGGAEGPKIPLGELAKPPVPSAAETPAAPGAISMADTAEKIGAVDPGAGLKTILETSLPTVPATEGGAWTESDVTKYSPGQQTSESSAPKVDVPFPAGPSDSAKTEVAETPKQADGSATVNTQEPQDNLRAKKMFEAVGTTHGTIDPNRSVNESHVPEADRAEIQQTLIEYQKAQETDLYKQAKQEVVSDGTPKGNEASQEFLERAAYARYMTKLREQVRQQAPQDMSNNDSLVEDLTHKVAAGEQIEQAAKDIRLKRDRGQMTEKIDSLVNAVFGNTYTRYPAREFSLYNFRPKNEGESDTDYQQAIKQAEEAFIPNLNTAQAEFKTIETDPEYQKHRQQVEDEFKANPVGSQADRTKTKEALTRYLTDKFNKEHGIEAAKPEEPVAAPAEPTPSPEVPETPAPGVVSETTAKDTTGMESPSAWTGQPSETTTVRPTGKAQENGTESKTPAEAGGKAQPRAGENGAKPAEAANATAKTAETLTPEQQQIQKLQQQVDTLTQSNQELKAQVDTMTKAFTEALPALKKLMEGMQEQEPDPKKKKTWEAIMAIIFVMFGAMGVAEKTVSQPTTA